MDTLASHLPHVNFWLALVPAVHQLMIERVRSRLSPKGWRLWGIELLRWTAIVVGTVLGFVWSWQKYGFENTVLWTVLPLAGLWALQRFGSKSSKPQAAKPKAVNKALVPASETV